MMPEHKNIAKVFREHYKELCMISYYYIQNKEEAQDIVQDVFVTIIAKDKIKCISDLKSYLKAAVRNATLKRIQKMSKVGRINQKVGQAMVSDTLTKEQELILMEKKVLLYKEIEKLPKQCKKVFLLCCAEGLKYRETAEILEVSVNTVKTQIKKAFKTLRLSLDEIYFLLTFAVTVF